MKKIIEFLEKNGIEYKLVICGNPYYYNDGFTVPAISIRFDYESIDCSCIPEMQKKERVFLESMERRKNHCIGSSGNVESVSHGIQYLRQRILKDTRNMKPGFMLM